jgi:hypothetical protein
MKIFKKLITDLFKKEKSSVEKCTAVSCINWSMKGCTLNKELNFFNCGNKYVVGTNKEKKRNKDMIHKK